MVYCPLNYESINLISGSYSPSTIKAYNNRSFAYWCRSLFQRAASVYDFTLPDAWQGKIADFFKYCLFRRGFVAVSKNDDYGLFFQPCSLYGQSFYYQPTKAIIANPVYSAELDIGTECELFELTPDYMGIYDIVELYASQLSELDNAINIGIVNDKMGLILGAKNKAAATALEKAMDKINAGDPAVIYDTTILSDEEGEVPWQIFEKENNPNSYHVSEQLEERQTLINGFDNEIGITTLPYKKKERMVTDEALSTQLDSTSRLKLWLRTMKGSIEEIKELYPDIKLDVEIRSDLLIGEEVDDEQIKTDIDRT